MIIMKEIKNTATPVVESENVTKTKEESIMNNQKRNRKNDAETLIKMLNAWQECAKKAANAPAWAERYGTFKQELVTALTTDDKVLEGDITIEGTTHKIDAPHYLEQTLMRLDNYERLFEESQAALNSLPNYRATYMKFVAEIIGAPVEVDGEIHNYHPWDNCETCEYKGNKEVCQACADVIELDKQIDEDFCDEEEGDDKASDNIVQKALDPESRITHLQNTQDKMSQDLVDTIDDVKDLSEDVDELVSRVLKLESEKLQGRFGNLNVKPVQDNATAATELPATVDTSPVMKSIDIGDITENANLDSSPVTGRDMANTGDIADGDMVTAGDIMADNEIAAFHDININIGGNVNIIEDSNRITIK
jgi:hypothetical protein